ncbi:MAG: hypothetical protein ACHQHN_08110 [Sphingobacteriales bacterium]
MSEENKHLNAANGEESAEVILIIDIEEYFLAGSEHPEHDPGKIILYRIKIDGDYYETRHSHLIGEKILELANKNQEHYLLKQKIKQNGEVKLVTVAPKEVIDFSKLGVEKFLTEKLYEFFIDQRPVFKTVHSHLTVRTILVEYAKVDPLKELLAEKQDGGFKEFKDLDEELNLSHIRHFTLFDIEPTPVS